MDTIKINKGNAQIVAHRGLSGLERENTASAFVAAGNRSYFGIETDVRVTADGNFVLLHDDDVVRCGGDYIIPEKSTLQTIQSVQLYDMDGKRGRVDLRIPELVDYLRICKRYNKVGVLEFKGYFSVENMEKVVGPCIQCANPIMLEKISDTADFLVLDGEHGIFNNENLVDTLMITRLKKVTTIVRVADCKYDLIARALYMGADGIMIPRCETLDQVKTAVESMNFYPVGKLGCGGHGQFREGENYKNFKRHLVLQIESPLGTNNLPKMLEQYGEYISAIVVGPYDYSILLGKPQQFEDPFLIEHIQKTFDICKKYDLAVYLCYKIYNIL